MSFNYDEKGIPYALRKYQGRAQKYDKLLYFDRAKKELEKDDITDEMMGSVFGHRAIRTKGGAEKLREELFTKIKEDNLDDNIGVSETKIDDDSIFIPYPPSVVGDRDRDVYFISGKSESGKTTFAIKMMNIYRKAGIKKVFVITDEKDKKFEPCVYLDINEIVGEISSYDEEMKKYEKAKIAFKYKKRELKNNPEALKQLEMHLLEIKPKKEKTEFGFLKGWEVVCDMFKNSVILFDDYENNPYLKQIEYLRDALLTKGRKHHTNMLIINHLTNAGPSFKLIKAETTHYVIFANSQPQSRNYLMNKYADMSKPMIKRANRAIKYDIKYGWGVIDTMNKVFLTGKEAFTFE